MSKQNKTVQALSLALTLFVFSACEISEGNETQTQSGAAGISAVLSQSDFNPDLTSTYTYLQNYVDTRLLAGYDGVVLYSNGSLGYSNLYVRYTTDNWSSSTDVALKIESPTAPHLVATVTIPLNATALEYAVYAVQEDGSYVWDNNRKRNFKADVFKAVADVSVVNNVRTITYKTKFNSCVLHYGVNGWKNVTETNMNFSISGGVRIYKTEISGLAATDKLDFCFRDNEYNWDNNNGKNWFNMPGVMNIDVYPEIPYATTLLGATITAYKNGKYYGTSVIESHHSGYYVYASFSNAEKADYTFVIDVVAGTTRYYGVLAYRADSTYSGAEIIVPIAMTELK